MQSNSVRQLVVDRGNSYTKVAIFSNEEMLLAKSLDDSELLRFIEDLIREHSPEQSILCSVRRPPDNLQKFLVEKTQFQELTFQSSLPIQLKYDTPETLGMDRVADAVGGWKVSGQKNCLVIDCGTCITYNLVVKNEFIGGAIAPGLNMRFRALNEFTDGLPLVKPGEYSTSSGKSTEASILLGVQTGAVCEMENMIELFCSENDISNVIITGGDLPFFEKEIKLTTFATPWLTLIGLNEILLGFKS
ncbi:MAG: type III pantothenate kinase [Flavobacteriales bacterium]|nr:type III pantothenate kinase [Flavobacteriales bacterium]